MGILSKLFQKAGTIAGRAEMEEEKDSLININEKYNHYCVELERSL